MGNKDKTVSFRVNEDTFGELRDIAEERDISLSSVLRDYVDTFVSHDGRVRVVGEDGIDDPESDFPPRVEVPKEFIREHERLEMEKEYLELEVGHLREQLEEQHRGAPGPDRERRRGRHLPRGPRRGDGRRRGDLPDRLRRAIAARTRRFSNRTFSGSADRGGRARDRTLGRRHIGWD